MDQACPKARWGSPEVVMGRICSAGMFNRQMGEERQLQPEAEVYPSWGKSTASVGEIKVGSHSSELH